MDSFAMARLVIVVSTVVSVAALLYARDKPSTWAPPRWAWVIARYGRPVTRESFRSGALRGAILSVAMFALTFVVEAAARSN